uniref:Uncharacterized protein n=1 Tax=Rhipicephalus microplus TaxID=6941 RepID=A0A6G5AH11_RHIMP
MYIYFSMVEAILCSENPTPGHLVIGQTDYLHSSSREYNPWSQQRHNIRMQLPKISENSEFLLLNHCYQVPKYVIRVQLSFVTASKGFSSCCNQHRHPTIGLSIFLIMAVRVCCLLFALVYLSIIGVLQSGWLVLYMLNSETAQDTKQG